MPFGKIVVGEFRFMVHKSKALWIIFGIPVLYSLLFGLAYSPAIVRNIPMVIYDQDQSAASRQMVQAYADSERYRVIGQVTSDEEMQVYLQQNQALVAVVIPNHFAHDIKLSKGTDVLIIVNAQNLSFANTILATSPEILQTFSAGSGQKLVEAANQMPDQALRTVAPVRIGIRVLNNPTVSYSNFVLAGMGANGLQLALVIAVCTVLTGKRIPDGSGRNLYTAARFIVAKLIPYWLAGLLAYFLYLLLIISVFKVPFRGMTLDLLLIGSVFTGAMVCVGGFFSVLAPNEVVAIQAPILYIMPAFLFSGYSWPHLAMNEFCQAVSAIMPLSYAADTIRDILLAGYAPLLARNSLVLLAIVLVLLLASTIILALRQSRLLPRGKEELV